MGDNVKKYFILNFKIHVVFDIPMIKKTLLITVFCLLAVGLSFSQNVPRLQKYVIGVGAKAYLPASPDTITRNLSEDGSVVYTCEVPWDGFNFSVIMVQFKDEVNNESQEELLISYLDYLKGQFKVSESAGYGKGHAMDSHPQAKGVIDFWVGEDKTQYQLKGWIDSTTLAVMIIYGKKEYPIFNVAQLFLNGFRFPD